MRTLFLAMCVMGMAGCSHNPKIAEKANPCPDTTTSAKPCPTSPGIDVSPNGPCHLGYDPCVIPAKKANKAKVLIPTEVVTWGPPYTNEDFARSGPMDVPIKVDNSGTLVQGGKTAKGIAYFDSKPFVLVKLDRSVQIVGRGIIMTIDYADNDHEAVNLFAQHIADYLNSLGDNPEFKEAQCR